MTPNDLIASYISDMDSPFHKLRYYTREHYGHLCRRISQDLGDMPLTEIKARQVKHCHEKFLLAGTISMGHSVIGMLRILMGFGATILDEPECVRISSMLGMMRFTMAKARVESLTAEQATRIRGEAHRVNRRSIALMQAFQFELMLRQKDCLGEWMPEDEPGESDTFDLDMKWHRGLRWEEIDENFILTHVTSKRQKEIVVDLKLAAMVINELTLWFGAMDRSRMPDSGPVIVAETTGLPWRAIEFRRQWRVIATNVGIPKEVRNMDTRSGAITEATDAGIPVEQIRHASTHSDISMVQRYSRDSTEKIADVMQLRVASRKG